MQPRVLPGVAPGLAPGAGAKAALVARRDVCATFDIVCATFAQLPFKGISTSIASISVFFAGIHEGTKTIHFPFWVFCFTRGGTRGCSRVGTLQHA